MNVHRPSKSLTRQMWTRINLTLPSLTNAWIGLSGIVYILLIILSTSGLPDFSWHNIPKRGKIYQITKALPKDYKIYQITVKYTKIAVKYTNIFHYKSVQNLPKLAFLVWKYTIWQPWSTYISTVRQSECRHQATIHRALALNVQP
jgi:hypothetical protein